MNISTCVNVTSIDYVHNVSLKGCIIIVFVCIVRYTVSSFENFDVLSEILTISLGSWKFKKKNGSKAVNSRRDHEVTTP